MESDFKHIVKESLREAFYTKKVTNESLFGHKFKIIINGEEFTALISRNTKPGEKDYRISFFYPDDLKPVNHWDMDKEEMVYTLTHKKLPDRFNKNYVRYHIPPPQLIFKENFNEVLLFLENSVRELELYIDNKQPA